MSGYKPGDGIMVHGPEGWVHGTIERARLDGRGPNYDVTAADGSTHHAVLPADVRRPDRQDRLEAEAAEADSLRARLEAAEAAVAARDALLDRACDLFDLVEWEDPDPHDEWRRAVAALRDESRLPDGAPGIEPWDRPTSSEIDGFRGEQP